jgi:hypothetical protein
LLEVQRLELGLGISRVATSMLNEISPGKAVAPEPNGAMLDVQYLYASNLVAAILESK